MQVLIVQFPLEGITEAEYYRGCDEQAPLFADIPGLIAKVWIASAETARRFARESSPNPRQTRSLLRPLPHRHLSRTFCRRQRPRGFLG